MKKFLLAIILILLTMSFSYAESDLRFLNALKTCSPYNSNGAIEVQNINADYKSQIIGWENDKCIYKKYVSIQGISICTTCRFNEFHIKEIVRTMETYKTGYTKSGIEVDINDVETMKQTPVIKLWNQYLADPNICNVEF